MKWNAKFREVRKQKRQKALNDHLRIKNLRLLTFCFSRWRQETADCLRIHRKADEIRDERNQNLMSRTFKYWSERLCRLGKSEVQAENHNRIRLIRYVEIENLLIIYRDGYRLWRIAYDRLIILSDILDDYLFVQSQTAAIQYLRVWRMRYFQLRGAAMQADLFKQRSNRLKLRLVLRMWHHKVKAKTEENVDTTGLLAVESPDRAHTAPLTPGRSTRRLLWRTLNSR